MGKFQVWAKDRYNRHEVVNVNNKKGVPEQSWDTPEEAFEAAKRFVCNKNCGTSLTFEEQQRLAEYVAVVMPAGHGVYVGNLIHGVHKAYVNDVEQTLPAEFDALFYLGIDPDEKEFFLKDGRRNLVTTITNSYLTDKMIVFVHPE